MAAYETVELPCSRSDGARPPRVERLLTGSPLELEKAARRLLLLQEQRRLLAQQRHKPLGRLRQEPRQRHFDAQCILQHFDRPRCTLAERAHVEPQRVAGPCFLFDHDHRAEVSLRALEPLLEPADSLGLAQTVANDGGDSIAQGGVCAAGIGKRASMIARPCDELRYPARGG